MPLYLCILTLRRQAAQGLEGEIDKKNKFFSGQM